jgi:hypothetical protein
MLPYIGFLRSGSLAGCTTTRRPLFDHVGGGWLICVPQLMDYTLLKALFGLALNSTDEVRVLGCWLVLSLCTQELHHLRRVLPHENVYVAARLHLCCNHGLRDAQLAGV